MPAFGFFLEFVYSVARLGRVRIFDRTIRSILNDGSISKRQLFHQVASLAITVKSKDLYTVAKYALENMDEHDIGEARA